MKKILIPAIAVLTAVAIGLVLIIGKKRTDKPTAPVGVE